MYQSNKWFVSMVCEMLVAPSAEFKYLGFTIIDDRFETCRVDISNNHVVLVEMYQSNKLFASMVCEMLVAPCAEFKYLGFTIEDRLETFRVDTDVVLTAYYGNVYPFLRLYSCHVG